MWLDSSFLDIAPNQVYLGAGITDAGVFCNVVNTTSFGVTNNKGDPDVWMNIRK